MTNRVGIFIDGQNLVKAVTRHFHTRVHPILLARHLAGDRELTEVRYYSGIHQPRINPEVHALATRRHKLIRRTGVTVIERPLQYHWEWRIDDRLPNPRNEPDGAKRQANVERSRVAREKGIDLALGLDAVAGAFNGDFDTMVVVSRDRDLLEIAHEINERTRLRNIRVEVALVAAESKRILDGYDYTHWIDKETVEKVRDDFNYKRKLPKKEVAAFLQRVGVPQ